MSYNNADLAQAFPVSLRDAALRVASALPQPSWNTETFSVRVAGEAVLIPYRIYHDPALVDLARLTPLQVELLDCLLTRHHSGFVREKHLMKILCFNHEWIPPFVVQLVGEYVIEILHVIRKNLHNLDPQLYRRFLTGNPAFFTLVKQRVTSYWDCYHRWVSVRPRPCCSFLKTLVTAVEAQSTISELQITTRTIWN
ncbi:MAG TPA: hypothetical protein VGK64_26805 [Bryobacteraceae bacterium]